MTTYYFSQVVSGYLQDVDNWFLDSERTIPSVVLPNTTDDVVFSGMETIAGYDASGTTATYKTISANGVSFYAQDNTWNLVATNGITAINSTFFGISIQADGSYESCNFASLDYGNAILTGNITLRNCSCISTHDADPPAIAGFVGNVNAYYPTSIVTGAVNGTLIRHGYGLRNTCIAHCHLDEASGTREVLDLYEEEGISEVVISEAGVFIANGTYKRDNPSQNLANTNQAAEIVYNGNEYQIDLGGGDYYYTTDFVDWFCTNSIYNPPPTTVSTISGFTVGSNTGLIGNAAKFNFNSLINDASELIAEFSISVWVNFLAVPTGSSDCIVGTGQTYGENFTIYGNNNRIRLYFDSSSSDDLQSDPISANAWYHCVLTVTLDAIKFYVNGEYIGEKTDVHLVNSGGFALSKFFGGNRLKNNTLVDELNIFSVELNQAQVNSLYNNGLGFAYPFRIPGSKKIDLYKLLGIPFPAKDYKYSRLLNLPFFVKI
jgi:hypothetical protein